MLVPFEQHHFKEYQSWFTEPTLAQFLGPLDEEWLTAVLSEKDGAQYAFVADGLLIGVVGLKFPVPDHPYYVLTDIAVNPKQYQQGWGSKILRGLLRRYPLDGQQYWLCFIDVTNTAALAFVKKHGWTEDREQSEAELLAFRYPSA